MVRIKVLGFVGSGRIGGNTDILVQQALLGATEKGAVTKIFYLDNMNIKGCNGCGYCKSNDSCRINDDMQEIYEEIVSAGAIIIGSPIYMMQITAQTKLLIDRLYAFRNKDHTPKIDKKKLLQIYVCRQSDPIVYQQYYNLLDALFNFLGFFKIEGAIKVGDVFEKGDIRNNVEVMQIVKNSGGELICS